MSQPRLFTRADLSNYLQKDVDDPTAEVVARVVWGWIRPRLTWDTIPATVPPEVVSWALELGAIAHENPAGLASYQLGQEGEAYGSERRVEILAEVQRWGTGQRGPATSTASFPDPVAYPDPVRPSYIDESWH